MAQSACLKSLSSPGGGGYNELRIEDRKGQEQIFVHAQRDWDENIEHDQKIRVGHERHDTVEANSYESGDALSASLIYATSLFERSTVERLAAHWRNLLEAICREPARRVGELPLLDRSERDLLLAR